MQVIEDIPDWSGVLKKRFEMKISSSRCEKTYTMYSNENEYVGEQLLENQRKRHIKCEDITATTSATTSTKKAKTSNVSFDEYVDEIADDSEIIDEEPLTDWEFDTPIPSWLRKAMERHETLIARTDPYERFQSAKEPIWWRIIDVSDPNIVQEFVTKEEFSNLNTILSNALNIGHKNDWTILEPAAERCLQSLDKLDTDQIRDVGEIVKLKGIYGAVLELRKKMVKNTKESELEFDLFGEGLNCKPSFLLVEEEDYLDIDVGFIMELVRYTCEMLAKNISQRKNSERGIDMFIKRHIFSCLDDILDSHFGEMVSRASRNRKSEATDASKNTEGFHLDWMFTRHDLGTNLPYGREFSLCERAGSRIGNDKKDISDILKALKTLRDMHKSLVKAIITESGGALSNPVLYSLTKLLMPGFASSYFSIRVVLVMYVGGGFYASFELAKFDIPTSYDEIRNIIKIARIMLQVKKLLRSTIFRFKLIKERAEKEKFAPGKVVMNKLEESRTPNKPTRSKSELKQNEQTN